MGFFDFVKQGAENLWGAVKTVASRTGKNLSFAKKAMDFVKDGYEKVTKIPVIGNMVKQVGNAVMELPIPYTPVKIKDGLKTAEQAINIGDKIFN